MRVGVLFGVVVAVCVAVGISLATKTGRRAQYAQTSPAPQTTNAPQVVLQCTADPAAMSSAVHLPNASVIPESNNFIEVYKPLEEFNMCTLSTRIGDERGPITVILAAEDEERMRAPGSFYQISNTFSDKHRTFTSYCSDKDNVYLTFNPKIRR